MNNARRKKIEEAKVFLQQAVNLLEGVRDQEQEAYDNMPESFQEGDKGDAAQTAINALESALDDLQNCADNLDEVE